MSKESDNDLNIGTNSPSYESWINYPLPTDGKGRCKMNIVWHKIRKDGGPDGRGVGFYFRNTTEIVLFGVRGANARTLRPGRKQVNVFRVRKQEHSRKPDELYDIIEACSPGPYLELFARGGRPGWSSWGNQAAHYFPSWPTYSNHSMSDSSVPFSKDNFALKG
jgi:hypothetical protein